MYKQQTTKSLAIATIICANIFSMTPVVAGTLLDNPRFDPSKSGLIPRFGKNTGIISCILPTEGNYCEPEEEQCHGGRIVPNVVEEMGKGECLSIGGEVMQP